MGKKTNFKMSADIKACIDKAKKTYQDNNSTYEDTKINGGWTREEQICEAIRSYKHLNGIR